MPSTTVPELDIKFGWTQDDVPKALQEDLEINPQCFELYVQRMGEAVKRSLRDPFTSPRLLTAQAIKERVALAHKIIMDLRYDGQLPLRRIFDALPERLMETLRRGEHHATVAEEAARGATWPTDKAPFVGEKRVVDDQDGTRDHVSENPDATDPEDA